MIDVNKGLLFAYKKGDGVGVVMLDSLQIGRELASVEDVRAENDKTNSSWNSNIFTKEGIFLDTNQNYTKIM